MPRPSEVSIAPLNGLVLAGGNSRRMGRDKTALRIHGRTQAEHVISLLSAFCETVFVSVRPEQDTDPRFAATTQDSRPAPRKRPVGRHRIDTKAHTRRCLAGTGLRPPVR